MTFIRFRSVFSFCAILSQTSYQLGKVERTMTMFSNRIDSRFPFMLQLIYLIGSRLHLSSDPSACSRLSLGFESITRISCYSGTSNCGHTFPVRMGSSYPVIDCVRYNGNYLHCCCSDDNLGKATVLQALIGLHSRNCVYLLPGAASASASVYRERVPRRLLAHIL